MHEELELEFKGKSLKGRLVKETKESLTLKLASGYNAVLNMKEVKIFKREKLEETKKEKNNVSGTLRKKPEKLPKVVILHTGGTIASKVDYESGAVSARFTPEELLELYPELQDKAEIHAEMIGNIFSGDMRFDHQNMFMEHVEKALKENPIGIIISHGTDTLHYSAAGLQYAMKNLPLPILLVGAQRSSDRPSSDAYSNLLAAVDFFIENTKKEKAFRRVGVCMHSTISDRGFVILDSLSLRKMHSSRRDTFKQINYLPYALFEEGQLKVLREELETSLPKEKFSFTKLNSKLKVGFFKTHPNLFSKEIEALSFYDALVIEGTGLGHMGVDEIDMYTKENAENLKALAKLSEKTKCIMSTQCVYGSIHMDVYSYGRAIQKETKVMGNHMNLSSETLLMRALVLLSEDSKNFDLNWKKNLEGFDLRTVDTEDEY